MEDWEHDVHELLAPLRQAEPDPRDVDMVVEKSVARVKDAIGASDFLELATIVLVTEFLTPVLDIFAFVLGVSEENTNSAGDDGSAASHINKKDDDNG